MSDAPPVFAIDLTQNHNEKMMEYVNATLTHGSIVTDSQTELKNNVSSPTTYCDINNAFGIHNAYSIYIYIYNTYIL